MNRTSLRITTLLVIIGALSFSSGCDRNEQPPKIYKYFAYMVNAPSCWLNVTEMDVEAGGFTWVNRYWFPSAPTAAAADPSGRFVYTAGSVILGFSIDPASGVPSLIQDAQISLGTYATSMSVGPYGRFLYVTSSLGLHAFGIGPVTGALSVVPGSPFTAGLGPTALAVSPLGRLIYVANGLSNNVSVFRAVGLTGELTEIAGSPFASGEGPSDIAVDPFGRFVYITNSQSRDVTACTMNLMTGSLVPVAGSPFATPYRPLALAMSPTGKSLYVTISESMDANGLMAYAIDQASGGLAEIAGSPYATALMPHRVIIDPSGRFVYVLNRTSGLISGYLIDAETGGLRALPNSPFGTQPHPQDMAIARIEQRGTSARR